MENDPAEKLSFSALRRWGVGLNVILTVAVVLALVAMVNYLAIRHYQRLDVTDQSQSRLSDRTREVLRALTNEVKVTVYFDSTDVLYTRVTALLKEYKYSSPKIEVELVDYTRDPAAAKVVKSRYKLTQVSDRNLVIFDGNGRTRFINGSEMSDYDVESMMAGQTNEVQRTHFKGELLFTSALYSIIASRPLKAYFLRGHGEHAPESTDQGPGYSKFSAILRDESNIPFEKLSLLGAGVVPADCSLLIIAGPTDPIPADELEKSSATSNKAAGRSSCSIIFPSAKNRPGKTARCLGRGRGRQPRGRCGKFPRPFRQGHRAHRSRRSRHRPVAAKSQLYLLMPRSISRLKGGSSRADAPKIEELLLTGPNSIVVTDIRKGVPQSNPALDQRGSVPLMVAVEKGNIPGVAAERGTSRLAVVGDSFFLQNDAIESVANRDFAANLAGWLVDQNVLLRGLAPGRSRPTNSP